jgi:hypothetical protein
MVFRIHNSTKILEADKPIKFTGLEEANEEMLSSLDSFQKLKLRTELVALGVPQGPKASKSLPSQEQEPNEGIY